MLTIHLIDCQYFFYVTKSKNHQIYEIQKIYASKNHIIHTCNEPFPESYAMENSIAFLQTFLVFFFMFFISIFLSTFSTKYKRNDGNNDGDDDFPSPDFPSNLLISNTSRFADIHTRKTTRFSENHISLSIRKFSGKCSNSDKMIFYLGAI